MVPGGRTAWAAVSTMAALAIGATILSIETAPDGRAGARPAVTVYDVPITGFGGYELFGAVKEVAADWVVPMITGGPATSHGSTWIGVQARDGQFLQIGTTEDRWSGSSLYQAFWSDPDEGFEPQFLLVAHPGDEVSARLTEGGDGWSGTIRDETTGQLAGIPGSVRYGVGSGMNLSEWVQEDPSVPHADTDTPYPSMDPVTFTALQVDGHRPVLTEDEATPLASPNGVTLIPGPPENDGFTFTPGTAVQGQYLRDTAGIDVAAERFDAERLAGGPTTGSGKDLIAAIATFDERLTRQTWPPGVSRSVRNLVGHNGVLVSDVRAWEASGGSSDALARLRRDAALEPLYSNAVRTGLGVPPVGLNHP